MSFAYAVSAGRVARLVSIRLVSVLLVLGTAAALRAQAPAAVELVVDPQQLEVEWHPPAGTPVHVDGGVHGDVELERGAVVYRPTEGGDFWTLGSDRLLVTVAQAGAADVVHRLSILAGSPADGGPTTGFEIGQPLPVMHGLGDQLFVSPDGALLGDYGALLVLDGSGDPAYLEYPLDDGVLGDPDNTDAGCAELRMEIDSPVRGSFSACLAPDDDSICGAMGALSALSADDSELFRLEVGLTETSTQFRALAFDAGRQRSETPWVTLGTRPATVRLDWWTGESGGLRLYVDGRVRGELRNISLPAADVAQVRVGSPVSPVGYLHELAVDAVTVRSGGSEPDVELATDESFEGDLASWHAVGQAAGTVSVSAAAALGGDAGLELDLAPGSGGWGAWVLDDGPSSLASMGLRFRLDVAGLEMAHDETLNVVLGQISDGATVESRFLVRLWRGPLGVKIRASAYDDSGQRHNLPYASLGAGPHHLVELGWRAASEPDSDDGRLRLWLDGTLVGELVELDNDEELINSVRFGAMYVQPGTHGVLRLTNSSPGTDAPLGRARAPLPASTRSAADARPT